MTATNLIISALLGSFWAAFTALIMLATRRTSLPLSPWPIVTVGVVAFAVCLLALSLACVARED